MAKAKTVEKISPEQHLANLQWLRDKGFYLSKSQYADYVRLKDELKPKYEGVKWLKD